MDIIFTCSCIVWLSYYEVYHGMSIKTVLNGKIYKKINGKYNVTTSSKTICELKIQVDPFSLNVMFFFDKQWSIEGSFIFEICCIQSTTRKEKKKSSNWRLSIFFFRGCTKLYKKGDIWVYLCSANINFRYNWSLFENLSRV